MNEQISSIQPAQLGKFQYTPMPICGMPELDNIDLTSFCSYPGAMGMNGSIFGCGGNFGLGYDPTIGMGIGMGPMDSSYLENMKNYQKGWTDYNVEAQKMQRNSDLRINGSMEAIQETALNLKDKINHNEQDQIQEAYQKYVNAVRSAYGEGSEEEINSRAISLYAQLNGGTSLIQDLRNNGHTSFLQGFIQSISLGTYGKKSAEDNIAEITNQQVPTGEKAEQNIGRVAGLGAVGAAAYGLTKVLTTQGGSILKSIGKILTTKAGIVGAAVAAVVGAITLATSKVAN